MNINTGQFSETFLPMLDGISITVKNYAEYLNKKYGKTIVVTPNDPSYVDELPIDIIRYKTFPFVKTIQAKIRVDKFKSLTDLLNEYPLDIVHAHHPFSSGNIALNLAKERNIPIVASFHNSYIDYLKKKYKFDFIVNMYKGKIANFYNQVDYVLAPNEGAIESLKEMGFKGKVDVIENGTEYKWESNLSSYKDYFNHRYVITKDIFVLLYVGQLTNQNTINFLLEVVSNLKQLKQNFRLVIVGEGSHESEMLRLIEQNKLSKYILFVGPVNDRDLLKTFYSRANLLLYPEIHDSVGLVVREAASFLCPSLGLKNTSVSNIIKDNYNGYLTDYNSLSYAQRIIAVLNDQNKVKVSLTAQKTLAKGFAQIVDDLSTLYMELINTKKQF